MQEAAGDDANLSALLGGLVSSDNWIIRKDKLEEEFVGNVRYQNDIYDIRADKALSRRAAQTYQLEGNVSARRSDIDYTASIAAGKIFYDNRAKSGYARGDGKNQVSIFYQPQGAKAYTLYGDQINFSDSFAAYHAAGNAELDDFDNTIYAGQMAYNTQSGVFEAWQNRPLVLGFSDEGDYALQADKISANVHTGSYTAAGRVQGWLVPAKDIKSLK